MTDFEDLRLSFFMNAGKAAIIVDFKNKVLKYLEKNAEYTPKNIADALSVPVSDVEKIISECEDDGTIRGYSALIDWEKAGAEKVNAIIEINVQTRKDDGFKAVAEQISAYPEVESLYLMSGAYDFAVIIEAKSMKEIANFVYEKLAVIDGVTGTATHFVLNRYKDKNVVYGACESDDREMFGV